MEQQEWNEYIGISAFKSSQTIKAYKNNHTRITDYLQMAIKETKPEEVIEAIKNLAENPNTRSSLLNTAIVFYNMSGKKTQKLIKYRIELDEEIKIMRIYGDFQKGEGC